MDGVVLLDSYKLMLVSCLSLIVVVVLFGVVVYHCCCFVPDLLDLSALDSRQICPTFANYNFMDSSAVVSVEVMISELQEMRASF